MAKIRDIKLKRLEGNHKLPYAIPFHLKEMPTLERAEESLNWDRHLAPDLGYDKISITFRYARKMYIGRIDVCKNSYIYLDEYIKQNILYPKWSNSK